MLKDLEESAMQIRLVLKVKEEEKLIGMTMGSISPCFGKNGILAHINKTIISSP